MSSRIFSVFLFGILFFTPSELLAQSATFSLVPNVRNPLAYERISITPQSTTIDLLSSTIVVRLNGVVIYEGSTGPFPITLGAPGVHTKLSATVTTGEGTFTATRVFVPGDLSLVVEPETSAPALYKGKATISPSSSVRLVAVTNFRTIDGEQINPEELSYEWTDDHLRLLKSSGVGKNTVMVVAPSPFRTKNVSVKVKTTDGVIVAERSVLLKGSDPIVRVYELDPLLGIRFEHALSKTYTITGSEVSFFGAPYGFSQARGVLSHVWSLNGSASQSGAILTLRPAGNGEGTARVLLDTENVDTREKTRSLLTISYGGDVGTTGIFGL